MIKKIIPSLILGTMAVVIAGTTSCEPIDGRVVAEDYKSCFSYVYDRMTGKGFVDVGSSYVVTSDITTSTYGVECNNVTFYDGGTPLSAKVTAMRQYFSADSAYVFMMQRSSSRTSGDFSIDSLRYGRVGAMWLTYFAEDFRYEVNVVPKNYNLGTDTVKVYRSEPDIEGWHRTYIDIDLHTRYNVTIDPVSSTLKLTVNGQKFEKGGVPYEFVLDNIPVKFTTTGYEVHADKVEATDFKGRRLSAFDAYNLSGNFTMSYEGEKCLQFYFKNRLQNEQADSIERVDIDFYNYNMGQIN